MARQPGISARPPSALPTTASRWVSVPTCAVGLSGGNDLRTGRERRDAGGANRARARRAVAAAPASPCRACRSCSPFSSRSRSPNGSTSSTARLATCSSSRSSRPPLRLRSCSHPVAYAHPVPPVRQGAACPLGLGGHDRRPVPPCCRALGVDLRGHAGDLLEHRRGVRRRGDRDRVRAAVVRGPHRGPHAGPILRRTAPGELRARPMSSRSPYGRRW